MSNSKLFQLLLVTCLGLQVDPSLQVGKLQVESSNQSSNRRYPTPWENAPRTGRFLAFGCDCFANANANAEQPSTDATLLLGRTLREQPSTLVTQSSNCLADIETLTSVLIRDLPSYANRVIQRSRRLDRTVDPFSYVLVAGNPEFEPLPLGPDRSIPTLSPDDPEPPQQVFITTLERQYGENKAYYIQHYHWLFLTKTPDGWRLAMMFTQLGSASKQRPPLPPRESSNSTIGQAVQLWLRDCRAGAIR